LLETSLGEGEVLGMVEGRSTAAVETALDEETCMLIYVCHSVV